MRPRASLRLLMAYDGEARLPHALRPAYAARLLRVPWLSRAARLLRVPELSRAVRLPCAHGAHRRRVPSRVRGAPAADTVHAARDTGGMPVRLRMGSTDEHILRHRTCHARSVGENAARRVRHNARRQWAGHR